MESDKSTLIIVSESDLTYAGFAGEEWPRAVFPTITGRPKVPGIMVGSEQKDFFVGTQAEEKRGMLILKHVIERGIIEDFDDMEKIWDHTFTNELRVGSEDQRVLLTLSPLSGSSQWEKVTQIMFDSFNVSDLCLVSAPVLACYGSGRKTGLVLYAEAGTITATPVYEGCAVMPAIENFGMGSSKITDYLVTLLNKNGFQLTSRAEWEAVKGLQQALAYVALDFTQELSQYKANATPKKQYEMPDRRVLSLGSELIQAPEALFQPSLIGARSPGIHQMIYNAILKCDAGIQPQLLSNIILAGSGTLLPGLAQRLQKEITVLARASKMKVEVIAPEDRQYSAWIGGSMLARLDSFPQNAVSKAKEPNDEKQYGRYEDYLNRGPSVATPMFLGGVCYA